MKKIDCGGLTYLKTIRAIKEYFNSIGEGEAIISVTDDLERSNAIRFAIHQGYQVEENYKEDRFLIHVEKRGCLYFEEDDDFFSILVMNDKLGNGDDEIGRILMKEYFEALNECNKLPKEILILNEGVKLFDETSEVSKELELLYKKGVTILVNDTSLKHYGLEGCVTFGEVINMYHMVTAINKSKHLIRL